MVNIIVIGDIHNDVENIMNYADKLSSLNFDVIICPGDFTDVGLRGFSQVDIARLVIEELKTFNKPIVAVPGNFDKEVLPVLEQEKISVHGKGKTIKGIGFYGFGGARTPFNTPLEPSEDEMKAALKRAFEEVKDTKIKIQVTHAPPARTKMDLLYTGAHVGSEAVRKFIEENRPNVAVSSHIHEARGVDELGMTKLLNAGRFPEGYCGMISVSEQEITTKVLNLV